MADTAELERRLRRLEDIQGVWQLFMDYRRHLDARDFRAYSLLFTEDGEWLGGLGSARGPAEIEALLERTLEVYPDDSTRTYHLVANPEIDVQGDRATAYSTWCFITRGERDEPVLSLVGHYRDELVRVGDAWRFRRRIAYTDVPYRPLEAAV
jgi:3-phenylpropionate/cinnamic acid dioxygenase small subunit